MNSECGLQSAESGVCIAVNGRAFEVNRIEACASVCHRKGREDANEEREQDHEQEQDALVKWDDRAKTSGASDRGSMASF